MRVVYHPDAEAELTEAALFYDKRVRGLVVDDELRILVVKHHKRHPDYWRHRLRDE